MCGYLVCAQPTEYTDPHTVYTPVETISDSPPDTQGRHSLRETHRKTGKSVERTGGGGETAGRDVETESREDG